MITAKQLINDMIAENANATIKDYIELRNELQAIEKARLRQHMRKSHNDCQYQLTQLKHGTTNNRLREINTTDTSLVTDTSTGNRMADIK